MKPQHQQIGSFCNKEKKDTFSISPGALWDSFRRQNFTNMHVALRKRSREYFQSKFRDALLKMKYSKSTQSPQKRKKWYNTDKSSTRDVMHA